MSYDSTWDIGIKLYFLEHLIWWDVITNDLKIFNLILIQSLQEIDIDTGYHIGIADKGNQRRSFPRINKGPKGGSKKDRNQTWKSWTNKSRSFTQS